MLQRGICRWRLRCRQEPITTTQGRPTLRVTFRPMPLLQRGMRTTCLPSKATNDREGVGIARLARETRGWEGRHTAWVCRHPCSCTHQLSNGQTRAWVVCR